MATAPVPVLLLGEWNTADNLKAFEYEALKLDGTAYDLTGYTARLQGRSQDNPANKVDLAGTLTNGPAGLFEWAPIGTTLLLTAGKRREIYKCEIEYTRTSDGKKLFSLPFALAVKAGPLAT